MRDTQVLVTADADDSRRKVLYSYFSGVLMMRQPSRHSITIMTMRFFAAEDDIDCAGQRKTPE